MSSSAFGNLFPACDFVRAQIDLLTRIMPRLVLSTSTKYNGPQQTYWVGPQSLNCLIPRNSHARLCIYMVMKSLGMVVFMVTLRSRNIDYIQRLTVLSSESIHSSSISRIALTHHQSTAQPLFARKSALACLRARFGLNSAMLRGSRVKGSVCERFRCSMSVTRS